MASILLGMYVQVAGHRAYFLKGVGLLLNQALINYGLSFLMSKEYTPLQVSRPTVCIALFCWT